MTISELQREQATARLRALLADYEIAHLPAAYDPLRAEFLTQAAEYRAAAQARLDGYMAKVTGMLDSYFDAPGKSETLARQTDEYHRLAGKTADFSDFDRQAPAATVIERFIAEREAFAALSAI